MLQDALATLYSDELARQATITLITGGNLATYGVENLVDDNAAHLFRSTDVAVAIQFDFSVKTPLGLIALIHATTEADDDVRLLGDDGADWVTPAFDVPFVQAGWAGSGRGRWPINPWMSPTALDAYDPAGYLSYLLAFGLNTPLAQNLEIGEVRFHPDYQVWLLDRGLKDRASKPAIQHETSFGIETKYPRRADKQRFGLSMGALDDSERLALRAHWDDVEGSVQPWLFVPDRTVNRIFQGSWEMTEQEFDRQLISIAGFAGTFKEQGRGLRPGAAVIDDAS